MRVTPIPSAYLQKVGATNRIEETHNDRERRHSGKDAANSNEKRTKRDEITLESVDVQQQNVFSPNLTLSQSSAAIGGGEQPLQDHSIRLTRMLVAARGQFEVRMISVEANKELIPLRIAAAGSGETAEKALELVARLERVIQRAGIKIKDLNGEDSLKLERARAQRQKQQKRVEELKAELRQKMMERKAREQRYLWKEMEEILGGGRIRPMKTPTSAKTLDAASEAKIAMQAQAMAAAEFAGGGSGGSASGSGASTGRASANSGGERPFESTSAGDAGSGGGEVAAAE